MIPFGNNAVTLYHREAGAIERHLLHRCSWRAKRTRTMVDGAAADENVITCRYADGPRAAVGDLLVLGACDANPDSAIEFAEIIDRRPGEAFVCDSFADYTTGVLPHYCARGSG